MAIICQGYRKGSSDNQLSASKIFILHCGKPEYCERIAIIIITYHTLKQDIFLSFIYYQNIYINVSIYILNRVLDHIDFDTESTSTKSQVKPEDMGEWKKLSLLIC